MILITPARQVAEGDAILSMIINFPDPDQSIRVGQRNGPPPNRICDCNGKDDSGDRENGSDNRKKCKRRMPAHAAQGKS